MKDSFIVKYGLLFLAVILNTGSSICSKFASGYPFFSWGFITFYAAEILTLMFYALVWQQVLKRLDLSLAYSIKPIGTILAMVWGAIIFQETFSWNNILGAVIIILGIHMVVSEHRV